MSNQLQLDFTEPAEQWRPVVGYEGLYEISNVGRVRSINRTITRRDGLRVFYPGRILQGSRRASGHIGVTLCNGSDGMRGELVHRLVLTAFVGQCPDGMEACHWNDVPDDNRLTNLRWDTSKANKQDRRRNGKPHHNGSKTHCKRGHEFTDANTLIVNGGRSRACRQCATERLHAWRHAHA